MTLDSKTRARQALQRLGNLVKDLPAPRWTQDFYLLLQFIKDVPAPPPAPAYTCEGKGGEYELLSSQAFSAGALRRDLEAGGAPDLVVYRDLASGQIFVRWRADFQNRMRRIR